MTEGYQSAAPLQDVPDGGTLAVEVGGVPIVLVRRGSRVTALENRCPHAGAPLSEGFVEGDRITCSWHGWTFELDGGRCPDDPSACVPTYDVRIEDGMVFVRV